MKSPVKILVADDHAILRKGIRALLDNEPNLQVVGEVDNGKDAIYYARQLKPELILIDLSMPGTNGAEAIHHIKTRHPEIKILVFTIHKTEEYVHSALTAGVSGYLLKDDSTDELIKAINNVLEGKIYLSSGICGSIVSGYLSHPKNKSISSSRDLLTVREREVIKLLAEDFKNKDVAKYLSISLKTVEKHRSNLMKKLDIHSTSGITSYAIKNGLVDL